MVVAQRKIIFNMEGRKMERHIISREEVKQVRAGLILNSLTCAWLIGRLEQRGIVTNKFTLSRIFNGAITSGEKAKQIVTVSNDIIKDYEKKING